MGEFSVTILGSGSAGNCALVEAGGQRFLVDAGLSARQMTQRLATIGVAPESLSALLITHEHCDHVSGVRVFCKQNPGLPVYCTRLTAEMLQNTELATHREVRRFQAGADFMVGEVGVIPFSVPHDAVDPVGFVFQHGSERLGFLTDLGVCTRLAMERVRGVSTLVIETNHDEKLLQNDTRRPWALKQRIMSRHGHLSNTAASLVLRELAEHGLRRAILGHLSRDCNSPELALNEARTHLAQAGGEAAGCVGLHCASQVEVSPRFAVRGD